MPGRSQASRLLVTVLAFCSAAQSHLITEPPQDVIIFFGSTDRVNFTCVTESSISVIWLNETGKTLSPEHSADVSMSNLQRDDGLVAHILAIAVKEQYNGTSVDCVAVNTETRTEERRRASFFIQGTLSAVSDLRVCGDHAAFLLSWSPPFSLDVTGVDPDIWYTVLISNVTDENYPVNVSCIDCHNLTQAHYTFTPDNPGVGHTFCFVVIPQNEVGDGVYSAPVMGMFSEGITSLFPNSQEQSSHVHACPSGSFYPPTPNLPEQGPGKNEEGGDCQNVLGVTMKVIVVGVVVGIVVGVIVGIIVGIVVAIVVVKFCKKKSCVQKPGEQLIEMSEDKARQDTEGKVSSQAEGQE